MDSIINTLKGYRKITDHGETQSPKPKSKSSPSSLKIIIAAIASVVSFLGIIAAVFFASEAIARSSVRLSEIIDSLTTICSVTRYPDSCFDSLYTAIQPPNPDKTPRVHPESIFKLSVILAADETSTLARAFRSINGSPEDAAVGDCVKLLGDALSRLNESVSATGTKKSGEWMTTEEVIRDMKTWISAAMNDVETCSDGLEKKGSKVGDAIVKRMETTKEMINNTFAIVSQIKLLLEKLH